MNPIGTSELVSLDEESRRRLVQRASQVCVVYPRHHLPVGCAPSYGRIGLEASGPEVELLVDRSVRYAGADPEVRAWITSGRRGFAGLDDLIEWLTPRLPSPEKVLSDLTDLEAVERRHSERTQRRSVDAAALEALLAHRVRGQEAAVSVMARRVSRHLDKAAPARPLALLALGPTGVGKTMACELLARCLVELGDEPWLHLRLDMAEYQEALATAKLTGTAPGYVGYRDPAPLVEILRERSRAVVLFDEIEKAHPNVFTTLLGLLDAGRLSAAGDRSGAVDGRDGIFLFTTNLCQDSIVEEIDTLDLWADPLAIDAVCRGHLMEAGVRPELLGRIGGFLVFRPLSASAMAEVTVQVVVESGKDYAVEVAWVDPMLVSLLLEAQPSGQFGARPIARAVEDLLGEAFAEIGRGSTGTTARCELDDAGQAVVLPDLASADEDAVSPTSDGDGEPTPSDDEGG